MRYEGIVCPNSIPFEVPGVSLEFASAQVMLLVFSFRELELRGCRAYLPAVYVIANRHRLGLSAESSRTLEETVCFGCGAGVMEE
jgi:hypothetical protein